MDAIELGETRIRYLEMIQQVIARISGHGATSKSYCITLMSATIGAAAALQKPNFALLAIAQAIAFAVIDSQYLRTERRYRDLFERVRLRMDVVPFDMTVDRSSSDFIKALFSWSILTFYGAAILVSLISYCAMRV